MRSTRFWMVAAVLTLFCVAGQARADVILSNLPGTSSGTGTNLGLGVDSLDRTKGVGLTTGATPLLFQAMDALMSNTGADALLSGGIFSDSGGNPGTLLAPFTPVNVPSGTNSVTFTLTEPTSFTLDANTTYWFVLDGPTVTNNLLWNSLSPNASPTANGVTFVGYRFSSTGGSTWSDSTIFNGMTIHAVVPEPGSLALVSGLGLLSLRRRTR